MSCRKSRSADASDVVIAAITDDNVTISGTRVDGLDAIDALRAVGTTPDERQDHGYDYDAEDDPAPRNPASGRRSALRALVGILIGGLTVTVGLGRILIGSLAVGIRLRGILVGLRARGGRRVGIGLGAVRVRGLRGLRLVRSGLRAGSALAGYLRESGRHPEIHIRDP